MAAKETDSGLSSEELVLKQLKAVALVWHNQRLHMHATLAPQCAHQADALLEVDIGVGIAVYHEHRRRPIGEVPRRAAAPRKRDVALDGGSPAGACEVWAWPVRAPIRTIASAMGGRADTCTNARRPIQHHRVAARAAARCFVQQTVQTGVRATFGALPCCSAMVTKPKPSLRREVAS